MFREIPLTEAERVIDVADHRADACDDLPQVVAGDAKRFAPIGEFFRNIDIDAPQMCCIRRSRVGCHKGSSFRNRDWMFWRNAFSARSKVDEHLGSNEDGWLDSHKSMAGCEK